jgi:hypothetical protein
MRGDERFELRHETAVATELEQRVDPVLRRLELTLGESLDLALREVLERELGERRPAPERDRGLQRRERSRWILVLERTLPFGRQPLEACRVDLCLGDAQHVARRLRRQHLPSLGTEEAAQLRDVALNGLRGSARRPLAPERVDERVDGDDLAPPEKKRHEEGALTSGR